MGGVKRVDDRLLFPNPHDLAEPVPLGGGSRQHAHGVPLGREVEARSTGGATLIRELAGTRSSR